MSAESTVPPKPSSKPSKPPTIRRRPRSVEEFIEAGAADTRQPTPSPEEQKPAIAAPTPTRPSLIHYMLALSLLISIGALALTLVERQRGQSLAQGLTELRQSFAAWLTARDQPQAEPVIATAPPPPVPRPATWLRWLALGDLQLARQAFSVGYEQTGYDALISAKRHLARLGATGKTEQALLQEIIDRIRTLPVLSLAQLDQQLGQLEAAWRRVTYEPDAASTDSWFSLPTWISSPWQSLTGPQAPPETTASDAGRDLLARLERLRHLAQRADQVAFRSALATLETWLTPSFRAHSAGRPWLTWSRRLAQMPLRHDLSALDELVKQLSARLSQDVCAPITATVESCQPASSATDQALSL